MKNYSLISSINYHIIVAIIGIFLSAYVYFTLGYQIALVVGLLPIILLSIGIGVTKLWVQLTVLFITNYLIMGVIRYITLPIPISNVFDIIYSIIISFIIIRLIYENNDFSNVLNAYTLITLIWLLYCTINIGNNVTGSIHFESWLRNIRPIAIYPFVTCIVISISCKKYQFIFYFLFLLAVFTILGAFRAIWQKRHGFDSNELEWLFTVGYRTHLINSGIRYFSFFSDAANFGCSMGLSFVILFISSLFQKKIYIKLLYLLASGMAIWGLLLSGTRVAIAIPFAGLALFTILAKNWKYIVFSASCFFFAFFILNFTTLGNSINSIRRMRTAFDVEDASFQVRLNNQRALKAYMNEAPFGIGIGVLPSDLSVQNKFYFVSTCATDSDLVYIWTRLGVVGLTIYLILQFFIYTIGSYIILFKIKNPEIRGPLSGMLCGCAGLLVASYGNLISFQFPNGLLSFTCLTLVFLGPFLDNEYSKAHGTT